MREKTGINKRTITSKNLVKLATRLPLSRVNYRRTLIILSQEMGWLHNSGGSHTIAPMKNLTNNPFMPFKGAAKEEDNLRQLINMRTETVNNYGFFAPDSLYPVYVCPRCNTREVSLSVLKPDIESLDSFEQYVKYLSSLGDALPLAGCNHCESDEVTAPAWIGFFTYIAEAACDLFVHIEGGKVKRAFKLHLLGDPEPVDTLDNDEDFLRSFGFPFSFRWAWKKLIDTFAGKDTFQVQKIHEGLYFAIDGSGKTPDEKWQGWFAQTCHRDPIDSAVVISDETLDSVLDQGPSYWLPEEDLQLIEGGKLRLFVFYNALKYLTSLKSTLLQRGVTLDGDEDPLTISKDEYRCEIPAASLLRTSALTGTPPFQMYRRHLISRIELLEAIRGTGNRLKSLFEENYLVLVTDENVLEVKDPDSGDLVRSISLVECSEISTLNKEDFLLLVKDQLGYDLRTNLFESGN